MTRKRLALLAATLIALPAVADESMQDKLRACAGETDDAARLACFDAATKPPAPPAEPAPHAEPAAEVAPEPLAKPAPKERTPAAAPQAAPAAPAAAAAPAAVDPVAEFGNDANKEDEIREISAMVVEVNRRSRGQYVVTLDNGQVWTEKDSEPYLRIKAGDVVRIKRIKMGGYRLVGRGNRSSAVVRIE